MSNPFDMQLRRDDNGVFLVKDNEPAVRQQWYPTQKELDRIAKHCTEALMQRIQEEKNNG